MAERTESTVTMAAALWNEIVTHAREGKPEEICGVIRGKALRAEAAVRGRNIAAERIENYEVDPQTLLLQFAFEDEGDEMMGIYHSHPVSVAYPSATDAWNAHYPESIYFICSLEFDDAPVIRAFRMTTHFLDLDFAALRGALDFYETRPGLFGYFHKENCEPPAVLEEISASVPAPFYLVLWDSAEDERQAEGRVVSIVEYPIEVA